MTLNPKFDGSKPVMMEEFNEIILETNNHVDFEIKFDATNPESPRKKCSGKLFLTNYRVILLNNEEDIFKGF